MEQEYRKVIEDQVKEKILGPGYTKDIIMCKDDCSDEVLDDDPTKLYCSGVMTPCGSKSSDVDDDDDADSEQDDSSGRGDNDNDDGNTSRSDNRQQEREDRTYFESDHIGVITCISRDTKKLRINLSYAKYETVCVSFVKMKAGLLYDDLKDIILQNSERQEVMDFLKNHGIDKKFNSLFAFDDTNKMVSLLNPLDYSINQSLAPANDPAMEFLKKLLYGKFFRRVPVSLVRELDMTRIKSQSVNMIELNEDLNCLIKWFPSRQGDDKDYVKIIVQNRNRVDEDGKISGFYKHCLFQTILKVTPVEGKLVSYTEPIISLDDTENNINEYIYRDVINYGKGIGCAAEWAEDGSWIATTYMPRCEVKKFSNQIDNDDIKDICTLRNLSIWGFQDEELLSGLTRFVEGYLAWHQDEITRSQGVDGRYLNAINDILSKQQALLDRLRDNIQFMRNNPEALTCFRIANTAMLVQMVVSRDANFTKNRNEVPDNVNIFDSLEYFEQANYLPTMFSGEPSYRPFQLAFLLMNVKSTLVEDDENRTANVDLIWFPTGGGKTEAYLALTALTIIARRRNSADIISNVGIDRGPNYINGISVIMRYTLRLLTSQQFERASFLVCALDFLREQIPNLNLGINRISIGLWVGKATTPNTLNDLNDNKYRDFLNDNDSDRHNPFPIAYCPWCGKTLKDGTADRGYLDGRNRGYLGCINRSCHFLSRRKLPIYYIDDIIYDEKPTLLFATVDKFAQLYRDAPAGLLRSNGYKSPDLIIQDELHLISGPLGSTVSLFEGIVEELASKDGHRPKIIASTATTRNTGSLIKSLYGKNRNVNIFPAQGTSYKDNYFSHLEEDALRCHIGIMPSGRTTSSNTEIRLTAILILARAKLAMKLLTDAGINLDDNEAVTKYLRNSNNDDLKKDLDNFWSIVLYYNSLKDLGRSKSRASQEVYENLRAKLPYFQIPKSLSFVYSNFDNRKKEFTSREDSSRIKKLLTDAESCAKLLDRPNGASINGETMDLIYASNMISVGIDIDRWNIMVMMGQPRSTSEYIQSSSRVARSHKGLVYNLINPQRNREFSLFENYTSFHSAYYKYVEPLSATPMNSQMLKLPLWRNIVDCYKYYISTNPADLDSIEENILDIMSNRYDIDDTMKSQISLRLREIMDKDDDDHMSSLRDIDDDCYLMINGLKY